MLFGSLASPNPPPPPHRYIYLLKNISFLWNYFLPWHPSHISSHQCRCQSAQIPSNWFWAVNGSYGNRCCHFSFIRKAPGRTMETRCDTKKQWHQRQHITVIRIYWSLLVRKRYMICWTSGLSPILSLLSGEPDLMWKPVWSHWNIQYFVCVYAEREKNGV